MEVPSLENFNEFINESSEVPKEKICVEIVPAEIPAFAEKEEETLKCPYCEWVPRAHAKDKQKAIKNHIKREHPEKLNTFFNDEKKKKVKISDTITEIENASQVEMTDMYLDEDTIKQKLVEDLDVLRHKFPDIYKCSYSYPESTIEHLTRCKNTYTRLINDKLTTRLAMNCLVALAKGGERVSDSLGVCDLDGFAGNIQENSEELSEIIQELIDSQVIDMGVIGAPEKLGLCLLNIGIKTAEQNKVAKNSQSSGDVALS